MCAPQAAAVTMIDPRGRIVQPYQQWASQARVPIVRRRVTLWVHHGACHGYIDACSSPGAIELEPAWYDPADRDSRIDARSTLLHELGHQVDYFEMTDPARARFRRLIRDPRPWRSTGGNSPHEKFAEAYSLCAWLQPHVSLHDAMGGYGYATTRAAHRKICDLIRRLDVAQL